MVAHFTTLSVNHYETIQRRTIMALDIDEAYDKIYRYCYYRLHNRETAEDITQETFLRYYSSDVPRDKTGSYKYLYTVARNLCIDEYRRIKTEPLPEDIADHDFVEDVALKIALDSLCDDDRELIILRYYNDVPVGVLCKMYGMSRFSLYRKINKILTALRTLL